MRRFLVPVAVVTVDVAVFAGARATLGFWTIVGYALAVIAVIVARYRFPVVAMVAALLLTTLTGTSYVLLLWAAYQAGQAVVSRAGTAAIVGSSLGALGLQLALLPQPRGIPNVLAAFATFVALPVLAGRYLTQHLRLASILDQLARQSRQRRVLVAEQERLRERLCIARDMHDSLGRRLSLVSIQAAALEVADLPAHQNEAVRELAAAARGAVDELHGLIGALRGARDPATEPSIGGLVTEFQAAGVAVSLDQAGRPRRLSTVASQIAYRVVEEGLTNAAKHAPGQPVGVRVAWEADTLLLTVTNPLSTDAPAPSGRTGHGLVGLAERVQPVGGLIDSRRSAGNFRLFAMLPLEEPAEEDAARVGNLRLAAIGAAAAVLIMLILPAGMLFGVR
jgi:signal transduction histidine kinase